MDAHPANPTMFRLYRALLICFHVGCGTQTDLPPDMFHGSPTLQTVKALRVKESPAELRTVVFYGKLKAEEAAALRFSMAGQVERVDAKVNDQKKAGDLLAVMAQPDVSAERARVTRQLQQLQDSDADRSPTQRVQTQEQIAVLQSQQQQLDAQLAKGVLAAPFDCIIRTCGIHVGKTSGPIVAAFDVVADRQPVVIGRLHDGFSQQLLPGQPIWVAISDRVFKCMMRESTSDGTEVIAEFSEPLPREDWLFDDVVEARFRLQTKARGYWLPIGSLRRDTGDRWNVLAAATALVNETTDVRLEARSVNVLQTRADSMLVDGNINDGDLIVSAGGHRVVAGQRVLVSLQSVDDDSPAGDDL